MNTIDSILLEQARETNGAALAEIYDRYAPLIYRYLYRLLGDSCAAEDLTSDVFVKLLESLNSPRAPRKQLRGWLYRVAYNAAMDHFRQGASKKISDLTENIGEEGDSPPASLEKRQRDDQLRTALRHLTPAQQQVIVLRFAEGMSLSDVGELMGKSEGSIKQLQHRAIRRLQKLLGPEEGILIMERESKAPIRGIAAAAQGK